MRWPDGSANEAGDVLIWTGEDGITDTLLPRLLAAGGNPDRVHFVDGITEHGKARAFDPATDMPELAKAARRLPNLKLIILDPIVSAVPGDSHKNTEVRRGLQPVVDMGAELDCAVLGISHFAKSRAERTRSTALWARSPSAPSRALCWESSRILTETNRGAWCG